MPPAHHNIIVITNSTWLQASCMSIHHCIHHTLLSNQACSTPLPHHVKSIPALAPLERRGWRVKSSLPPTPSWERYIVSWNCRVLPCAPHCPPSHLVFMTAPSSTLHLDACRLQAFLPGPLHGICPTLPLPVHLNHPKLLLEETRSFLITNIPTRIIPEPLACPGVSGLRNWPGNPISQI